MIGTSLGAYQLMGLVGGGGFAQVYQAIDSRTGETVAVKVLREQYVEDPEFLQRFRREASTLFALPTHPNIAQPRDYGSDGRSYYLVMEFVEGPDLGELLHLGRLLPLPQALSAARQIAEALRCAHEHGVVHRDIKPQNVKVTPQGLVKVLDFGIAKAVQESGLTRTGTFIGTPEYLAPEIWTGKPASPRSDIYSWGILVHELLAGHPPFDADNPAAVMRLHLEKAPPSLRPLRPDLPPGYEFIVLRALAKRPDERFQSAREVLDALQDPAAYAARTATPAPSHRVPAEETVLRGYLVGTAGPPTGRHYALESGATLLGRNSRLGIGVADRTVSTRHAEIRRTPHGYVLQDAGSKNGTYVNGSLVGSGVVLQHGDRIQVGRAVFTFVQSAAPPADHPVARVGLPEDHLWAALCHGSALFAIGAVWVPFLPALIPLAIWLLARRTSSYVGSHAVQATVFQVLVIVGLIVVGPLYMPFLWLAATGYAWFGAFRCSQGHDFRYPIIGSIAMPRR